MGSCGGKGDKQDVEEKAAAEKKKQRVAAEAAAAEAAAKKAKEAADAATAATAKAEADRVRQAKEAKEKAEADEAALPGLNNPYVAPAKPAPEPEPAPVPSGLALLPDALEEAAASPGAPARHPQLERMREKAAAAGEAAEEVTPVAEAALPKFNPVKTAGASPTGSRDRSNSPSQTVEALPGSGSLLNRSVEAEEPVAQRDSNALPGFSNAFAQSPSSAATTEVEIEDEKPGVLNAFG